MSYTNEDLFFPAGKAGDGVDPVMVTPESAGWTYSGLRVIEMAPGETRSFSTNNDEVAILPLSGSCTVEVEGHRFDLQGRDSVFTRVSDFAYVPIDADYRVTSAGGGEFALVMARTARRMEPAYGPAEDVEVSVRGAGSASRQITNFLMADSPIADKLLAVEVITPGGNFSSYPPHKHDTYDPDGPEVELEEVYYFRFSGDNGYGLFREWKTDGEFDASLIVRDGDTVLCPYGYHGPSVAVPGHHMYFLNVMAGPGTERIWQATDDPAQTWVRETWLDQKQDSRLPLTSHERLMQA
jgi:5-deoxy-glucuronate isomerase